MNYRKRISDGILEKRLEVFGAVLIIGPKGCGKTTTAKQHAKSFIEFQDEDHREGYLSVAATMPSKLLEGEKTRLFDEWQDAPKIWGAVRKAVDDSQKKGQFILTGSTTGKAEVPHTGTMRISRMTMMPMSLFESGESNGSVSLKELFDHPDGFEGCHSDLDIDGIIHAICRGGWPSSLDVANKSDSYMIVKDLLTQICEADVSKVDGISRNSQTVRHMLRSYSRNICQTTDNRTLISDVRANTDFSEASFYNYQAALEKLFIISDVDAWCPAIRSKSAIRSTKKKNLVDPSLAVAALGIDPDYFNTDFIILGFLFESLVMRDLNIYSSPYGGKVSYYRDRYGLEADAVLHLDDGRYALCEVKLGQKDVDEGAQHLLKIEALVAEYNKSAEIPMNLPDLKIVITGTEYGYRRDDGVFVIPLACLRD